MIVYQIESSTKVMSNSQKLSVYTHFENTFQKVPESVKIKLKNRKSRKHRGSTENQPKQLTPIIMYHQIVLA